MRLRSVTVLLALPLAAALVAPATVGAAAKKTTKPKATVAKEGAACLGTEINKTSNGFTCALDNGKTVWHKTVVTTAAAATAPAEKVGGKLTVLCVVQEDMCQVWTKAFEKRSGIKTNFVRLSSGEAVARLSASKSNPEFDVMHGGPSDGYVAAGKDGLLEKYVSPNAAVISPSYKDATGLWTGVYVGVLGFCSNKSVLNRLNISAPRSWTNLVAPKLKGQIAMAHPATSGTAFTALWTQVQIQQGSATGAAAETAAIEGAFDYFKTLHTNILQYTKSGSAPGQMTGRGEVAVGVVFSHDCQKFQDEGMTDLVTTFPAEGTGYEIGSVAMVKGAKNTDQAKAYVDWALSAEAQELMAPTKSYQLPTNPEAKVSSKSVKLSEVKLVNYDDQKAGAAKKALVTRFDREIASAPR